MAGPGPLNDWGDWNATTRPLRPEPRGRPTPKQSQAPTEPFSPSGHGAAAPAAYPPDPWETRAQVDGPPIAPPYQPRPSRGPVPGGPARTSRGRRKPWMRVLRYSLLALLLLVIVLGGFAAHRLYAFGQAISPQGPLSSQTGFMSGVKRVNVVVLGYGGAGHDGAYLTDSMMVVSLDPATGGTTLISVPRDLWVQVPPNSGKYAKINAAYEDGLYNGFNGLPAGKMAAGAMAAQKVSDVTGLTVTYWVSIDFAGFRKLVDSLGGVTVNVQTAFTARYPRNDDPSIDAGWKIIHFNAGPQHMNGEQAIEYARARYVLDPPSEGTDFARSARQQILVRAILSRARQVSAWPGLSGATDALQSAMYTNMSLTDLLLLAQKMDFNHAHRVGLTNQNVLVDSQSSDGQSILLPTNDDWNAVRQYVAQGLAP
jgi:polyisoprenyl-teichoic acid--peptidoglycan teichoic acid transferase